MSLQETCKRAGHAALDFVSQTLRAFCNPALARPILLNPRSSSSRGKAVAMHQGAATIEPAVKEAIRNVRELPN
jgi:hypothetical protein